MLSDGLTTKNRLADGLAPGRGSYARARRRDPKAVEEDEATVVPTNACLRCHDVRPEAARARLIEPIPALAFDPLDKTARTDWARTADPKRTVYRDVAKRSRTAGGLGSVGEKAASAISDFVLLDMFAGYCTGREDAKGSIRIAERQFQRIYR